MIDSVATDPAFAEALGIVVVSFGPTDLLGRNLAAAGSYGDDVVIIVVDNFSTQENRHSVEELGHERGWHVVGMPDNRGFGAACNAGVAVGRELGCRTFLFLNPDARISSAVVAELRAHSLREPMALISPVLVDSAGDVVFDVARTDLRTGRILARPEGADRAAAVLGDWLCGACVVVHDDLLRRIGGFDEGYFLYWEDVDLGYRAVRAGGDVVLREDLVAVHDEGGTHDGGRRGRAKSTLYYRYNCRNRLLFARRHLPRRQLLRWLMATPAVSWGILLRGGRRQLLHSPEVLWAAVAGSLSGIAQALPALLCHPRPRLSRPSVLVVHPGAELYGSDRVLLESVAALTVAADVTVALPHGGPLVDALVAEGARVVRSPMPVLRKSALRPRGAVRLLVDALQSVLPSVRLIRRHGGVYVSTITLPSWLLLGRLLGRRIVCHVHEAERSTARPLRWAMSLAPRAANHLVCNSKFSRDVLTEMAPELSDRCTIIYNGVPGPADVVPAREVLDGPIRLLFIGRLSPRKGPQVAVRALRELVARGVDAHLELLGGVFEGYEWFERELRETVAELRLDDRVSFLGFRSDIWPVVTGADLVLIPSVVDEPFGNTAVEALLAARPLVVSDCGGLREAVEGYAAAQAVEPDLPERWADAVEQVIADWSWFRTAALRDAEDARRRHSPARYRRLLAEVVLGEPSAGETGERPGPLSVTKPREVVTR
jgi:GT2 family glycosyltransferase/glycosyltransferase involved in cell wall biosynthesis